MMTQLTIDSVQRDFKAWRSSRTKRGKIPDNLWDKTLKLLEHYPISQVVRNLGLNGGQVYAKRKQLQEANPNIAPVKNPVNFLELNMSPIDAPSSARISGNRLEIKRADGAVLAIEHFTEQTYALENTTCF
jgi:hypothetical protein